MLANRNELYLADRDWGAASNSFAASSPYNYAVLDDFLTEDTLSVVREYLSGCKRWSFMNVDGPERVLFVRNFDLPLVADLGYSLAEQMPDLFRSLRLVEYSAFMNRNNDGLSVHSDNGLITLNMYLTPDEDNLEPETGGMKLFDVKRRADQALHEFNAQPWCSEYFRRHTQGGSVRIGYKFNRAVLFDARTLHAAERMRFRCGTVGSHRLNLALRFDVPDDYEQRMARYSPGSNK